jgi:hypothetical protein
MIFLRSYGCNVHTWPTVDTNGWPQMPDHKWLTKNSSPQMAGLRRRPPKQAMFSLPFGAVFCGLQRRHVANRGQPPPTATHCSRARTANFSQPHGQHRIQPAGNVLAAVWCGFLRFATSTRGQPRPTDANRNPLQSSPDRQSQPATWATPDWSLDAVQQIAIDCGSASVIV